METLERKDEFGIKEIPMEVLKKILLPRELDVVRLYYLDKNLSYLEIGQLFGVTREKVRMICSRAVRKILKYKRENNID